MKLLILITTISWGLFASVFYDDDRKDFHEIRDTHMKGISSSIPSLVLKSNLKKEGQVYKNKANTLEENFNFCSDTPFAQETQLANCSASLIADDLVLTAAHCIDLEENTTFHTSNYRIVFDYRKESPQDKNKNIPINNVYEIESVPFYKFDWDTMHDIAILKLKRKVKNRKVLKINFNHQYLQGSKLFILGYPLGISQKLTDDSQIISQNTKTNSFRHHLDTFSVNSGSAIFDLATREIIGVHVRGTGTNYKKYGRQCNEWQKGNPEKDFGEGNMLSPLKSQILKVLNP